MEHSTLDLSAETQAATHAGGARTSSDAHLTVRVGCALAYEATQAVPALLVLKPPLDRHQLALEERLAFGHDLPVTQLVDTHGNTVFRMTLRPGLNEIRHDAIFSVPNLPDNHGLPTEPVPVAKLPLEVLRYTLPSRYCDSDKLMDVAWQAFGALPNGVERVQAICDWVHHRIEYRYGSGSALISAWDVVQRGYGVCRDLAHVCVALCRTFNLPARYVSGHLPDIGVPDPGIPMDFHAYFEVYLGGQWHTFDARHNEPRIGRIKIAHGMDAVDAAFATLYGDARLARFDVWAYQIAHGDVRVGDPVDLSRRLDGTPEIRLG